MGFLPLHDSLSQQACEALVFLNITNTLLISVGQLCDDNCVAIFDKNLLRIFKQNCLIIKGHRNLLDGLWDIPLTPSTHWKLTPEQQSLNVIIHKNKPNYELANFYHGALCSPVIRTLEAAIKNNNLISWPSIDKLDFKTNIIDPQAIHMGHLDQERSNLQSTKIKIPSSPATLKRTFETLNLILPFTAKEMTYGDMTGAFPYTSTRGNKYIYLMYDYDSNAILVHPLKSRQAHEIHDAWQTLTNRLEKHGH